MADVVISASEVVQGVTVNGKRSVEATLDFDTGDYVALGVPLATLLATTLGLKQVDEAYVVASASVDKPYTLSQFDTANQTVTYAYFVDNATDGTVQAPVLKVYSAGNELSGAVAASAQTRIRFVGS
jgi:hypothetical protein